jgi:imidazolonepropionase-like amidohydrolase
MDSGRIVLRDAAVLDPEAGSLAEGQAVVTEGGRVVEVAATAAVRAGDATVVDVGGRAVMPGLIDAHVHVNAVTADLGALETWSPAYVTAGAAGVLRGMLDRGFTTVACSRARGSSSGARRCPRPAATATPAGRDAPPSTSTPAARPSPWSPTAWPRCAGRPGSSCGGGRTTSR